MTLFPTIKLQWLVSDRIRISFYKNFSSFVISEANNHRKALSKPRPTIDMRSEACIEIHCAVGGWFSCSRFFYAASADLHKAEQAGNTPDRASALEDATTIVVETAWWSTAREAACQRRIAYLEGGLTT